MSMSALNHSDSPNDPLNEVLKIINELAKRSAGGNYIYRGECENYGEVPSNLYRQYRNIDIGDFDIEVVQKEIRKQAEKYTTHTNDHEILAELQHFGDKTNIIDFNTDYLIALFFACNGTMDKDDRVILLQNSDDDNIRIWRPRTP